MLIWCRNFRHQISGFRFRLQGSASGFRAPLQASGLRFRLQGSASGFRDPLQASGFSLFAVAPDIANGKRQTALIFHVCPLPVSTRHSTLQPFNPSTLQPFNHRHSTLQPFNPSTIGIQPFNPSTLQPSA
ncbi:MAG: hypothetical protein ACYCOU_03920, partial [Sulfobacillus sp.]